MSESGSLPSCGYAVFVCVSLHACGWLVNATYGHSALVAVGMLLGYLLFLGSRAALSEGSYLRRVVPLFAVGLVAVLSLVSGLFIANGVGMFFGEPVEMNFFLSLVVAALIFIPSIASAHLPFLFFKVVLNWQLRNKEHAGKSCSLAISQIFTIVAVCSVVLASPKFAARTIQLAVSENLQIGRTVFVPQEGSKAGFERSELTETNLKDVQRHYEQRFESIEKHIWGELTFACPFVAILAFLFAPAMWITFRDCSVLRMLMAVGYLIFLIAAIGYISNMFGLQIVPTGDFAWALFGVPFAFAGVVPMGMLSGRGMRLVARKRI